MQTKIYYAITTIRDTYIKQFMEPVESGSALRIIEMEEENIIYADLYQDVDSVNLALAQLVMNLNEFFKENERKDFPELGNMGLSPVKVEIVVTNISKPWQIEGRAH